MCHGLRCLSLWKISIFLHAFECPCSCSVPHTDEFAVTFCYSERKRRNTMYFVFKQYRMVVIQGILGQGTGWISVSWVTFCKFWGFQTYSCEVPTHRFLFLTYEKRGINPTQQFHAHKWREITATMFVTLSFTGIYLRVYSIRQTLQTSLFYGKHF